MPIPVFKKGDAKEQFEDYCPNFPWSKVTDTQGRQQRVLPYVEQEMLDVQAAKNTAKTATTTSTIATAMVVTTMKLLLIPDLINAF